jgi:nucleoside-diphosphate-sugar epimerase
VIDVSRQPGQVRSAVAALGAAARQWTFVSTSSVYADQSVALTEDSPLLPALEVADARPDEYGEGKVASEQAVRSMPQSLVVRAGLIGGPGDRSDRLGHYVARLALAEDGPVLVPDVFDQPMQVIDVRDLARWIVEASESGSTGVVHGVGEATTFGQLIDLSTEVAGHSGSRVAADPDWLLAHDVEPWMGPRSLPLWLPISHHGMGMMDDARSITMGLQRRPLAETLSDTLDDERGRGLNRPRSAGLTRTDEVDLIDLWHRDCREPDSAAST